MREYVQYHNDGSVRMDWYTFSKLSIESIMKTLEQNSRGTFWPKGERGRSTVREFR